MKKHFRNVGGLERVERNEYENDYNLLNKEVNDAATSESNVDDNDAYDDDEINVQDQWFDTNDRQNWLVSSETINNYDNEWNNDEAWDAITEEVHTMI